MNFPSEAGSLVLWIQAAVGFVGLLVMVERMIFFQHARGRVADLLLGITNHVRKKAYAEALHEASRARGPEARVVHSVLMRHNLDRTNLREIAQEAGQLEVPRIERNMRVLLGVAMLAPMLGMFGTVLGLIDVFVNVSAAEQAVAQTKLAEGLFQSLTSTAMGLSIAIPAYLIYLYLYGKGKRLIHRLERAGIEAVNIICDSREHDRIVSFREELESPKVVTSKKSKRDSKES
ncbi:MotA/TolQ/ExbB proton channel family protein [Akkermansiaceae bacterium]|nr:MotA/TolQ/ExbB proton channel family protein [Akkermansiaceae bacterium]MDB2429153.1 MotA/TolQ/ExbB proton channel family protein [Akkermansiaceae bacterium]MDB4623986.1 MotA/TolQ/ExbB proton channel family protein [Akkermansiaceae bacterium]MDB4666687.1 MotA/TolQ/ExbB proton channel family protein [bacterium]MDB4792427.1 MotA/TolQ/ExbB proton channel family protein [bacterium]